MQFKHRFFYIKPPNQNEYESKNNDFSIPVFHNICDKL